MLELAVGSDRCVLTAAADQTSLLVSLHPHALVNGLYLKYRSVSLLSSAFPSSSSLVTHTFIRSTSKGMIHVKQTAWSKLSFSHGLPESLWGTSPPAEVHGSADAGERGQSFFSKVKLYSGRFFSQHVASHFYPLTSLEDTEMTWASRLVVMKMFWLYWYYEIKWKEKGAFSNVLS